MCGFLRGMGAVRVLRMLISLGLLVAVIVLWGNAGWIHAKAQLAQILIERSWVQSQESGLDVKPWAWADTWPVAKLSFKNHGSSMYVLSGSNGSSLAFGPALSQGKFGEATIIHGHRDTHFAVLEDIELGSRIVMENRKGKAELYEIVEVAVVDSSKGDYKFDDTIDSLHLITCYPFDAIAAGGPLRQVVIADKVSI